MEHFERHKAFYNQPIRLTKGQREEPLEVIELFLATYGLSEVRRTLWHLLQVSLTTDNVPFHKAADRDQAFWFCHDLEELLEAVALLQQQQEHHSTKYG